MIACVGPGPGGGGMDRGRPHALLVDDDPGVRRVVTRSLESAGLSVAAAPDLASARRQLAEHEFSVAILDVNLPDGSGLDLCEEIHATQRIPVVMLTVVGSEADVIRALEAGADDYVRKPFGPRELVARTRAVLRRARADSTVLKQTITAGPLKLDSASYRAQFSGETLRLTPTEYRLLAFLVQNAGRVLTHDQLLHFVWGPGYEGEHHMLRVTMSRLRQKLSDHAEPGSLIRTMPGVGYEFVVGN
jgi:two-component system, OmpR family, KDP operon response regulator KdpE